ncbi:MAG: glutamate formimidoyltransferase, partial [Deltaproteobacteria bacterium]|nr:glutamate formimidoyltransferase [Deltaproteobacteria bacterium]
LECIPNFSEGRDLGKVETVVEEVRKTPGAKLLDYFSDPGHNRSVVTFIGEPEAAIQALGVELQDKGKEWSRFP